MRVILAHHVALFALCLVLATLFTYWIYRKTTPQLGQGKRFFLGALRSLALALLLFLLFEPTISRTRSVSEAPVIAALIDKSESMQLALGDADSVALGTLIDQLGLPGSEEVRYFTFGSSTDPIASDSTYLQFDAQRTNLAGALRSLRDAMSAENYSGVMLVSDGQINTGTNPLFAADESHVPIVSRVVGDTTVQQDIYISQLETNQLTYLGSILPFEARIVNEGFDEPQVTVELSKDGIVLDRATVTLQSTAGETVVELQTQPQEVGRHAYQVQVTFLSGETTHRNNTERVRVNVLDQKRSVLMIAGAPDPDVASLMSILSADENTNLTSYIQKSPSEFYEGVFDVQADTVDVLILAGFPSRDSDPSVVEWVTSAVNNRLPVLYILGSSSDLTDLEKTLGDVAPVQPLTVRRQQLESSLIAASSATTHPVFDGVLLNGADLRDWGPAYISESRWATAPSATTLLTASVRGIDLGAPVLTLLRLNRRRSASLLATGFWRWRNLPAESADVATMWPTVFGNLITWLAAVEDDRPVRVNPSRDLFSSDDNVSFVGQVYDESLQPIDNAEVTINVETPDGTQFPFVMDASGNGRYRLEAGSFPEGEYAYDATATVSNLRVGTDSGTFEVGRLSLEARTTRSDALVMRQIAERSGGIAVGTAANPRWADIFSALPTYKNREYEERSDLKLWRHAAFLFLIVSLLTIEWFIRKRSGMV